MRRTITAVLASLLVVSCQDAGERHDHSGAHPKGHDHHDDDHGHDGEPTIAVTLYSEQFELFAEYSAAAVNQESDFLIHLTNLDDFSAVVGASVTIELEGPAKISVTTKENLRPGIFAMTVEAPKVGTYRGRIRVEGKRSGTIEGLEFVVHEDATAAHESVEEHDDEGQVTFLKEQQWVVPFDTAFAKDGSVVASVEVAGQVDTPPGGTAEVASSVTGRLAPPRGGLLRPGTSVKKGQWLASVLPAPATPEAAATSELAVAEAEARSAAAQAALRRAERLIEDQAIAQQAFENAKREATVAAASVRAARRAAQLYAGNAGAGMLRLTAPIDGILDAVHAKPGEAVSPSKVLFRIVDTSQLWLLARVPEQDAARLRTDLAARYRVAGLDEWKTVDVTSAVTISRTVDPIRRTVDVIYDVPEPDETLRVGGLVTLSLPAGELFDGVVIEVSALLEREGRPLVYVQVDGEHFEERAVRVGPRSADRVGIIAGVRAQERVVTKGANLIRLAERAAGPASHGHIH